MAAKVLQLRASGALLGAENVVLELGQHAPGLGFETIIGVPNDVDGPIPDLVHRARALGLCTEVFPSRGRFDPSLFGRLRQFVRREQIDLVHCHGYKEDFYALLARLDVPLIATNHYWKRTTPALVWYAKLDSFLLRRFDRVVAVSEPIRQEMKTLGIPADRLSVIDNGVDTHRFRTTNQTERAALRGKLGIRPSALLIGTVASLTPEKGHRHAVDAMAELVKAAVDAQLLIVGDGPERARLERQAADLGLNAHVIFAGRREDIPQLLTAMDIFLLPSLNEGLPMALLEAMAAGRAVIATDVGGVGRAVQHGVSGLLVAPADSRAIAGHMLSLADQPEQRTRLGRQAASRVEQHFSSMAMVRAYCELYSEQLAAIA